MNLKQLVTRRLPLILLTALIILGVVASIAFASTNRSAAARYNTLSSELSSQNVDQVMNAANQLVADGSPQAIDLLVAGLDAPTMTVRCHQSMLALQTLGQAAVPALTQAAESKEVSENRREHAAELLSDIELGV